MTQEKVNNTVDNVLEEGRSIVKKANRRHVIVRNADGTKLVELSAMVVALIVVAMFFFQPFGTIAAIAAVAYGIYSKVKIEVVHELGNDETVVEVKMPQDED